MRKLFQDRRVVLALGLSALFSLVLLTSALGRMDFKSSRPIGGGSSERVMGQPLNVQALLQAAADVPFWKQVTFWVALLLMLVVITSLLDAELRRRLIRAFLRFAIFALALFYLIRKEPQFLTDLLARFPSLSGGLAAQAPSDALARPIFTPPQDAGWLSFAIGLGIVSFVGLCAWQLQRTWLRIHKMNSMRRSFGDFASIARDSILELRSGRSYENAILECYDRMSDVVARKRGLQRAHAMTPSEFSTRLAQAGLPRGPIRSLTGLFESVRYGRQQVGQVEIDQAISALSAIVTYCGESK